ncbi:MAG: DUF6427 family protein [Bacteroidetes bacterium]|nr:DUF6427 family protein [Bacteroidota bacterium]
MFINTIRSHQPVSLILIPIIGLLLWLPGFLHPTIPVQTVDMPLYASLDVFLRDHTFFSVSMGFLLSICEAFFLNYIIYQHQILTKKSWLPALMFVVLSACTPGLLWLNSQLIAGFFLLGALHFLLETYRKDKAFGSVFNSGILIGIAALFYLPSIVFLLFALISVILLRPFIWREWIILFLGSTVAPIYAGVYFFWHDQLQHVTHELILNPILHRDFFLKLPVEYYFLTIMTGLLLFVSAGRFFSGAGTTTLKSKKGISVMIWFLVLSLLSILLAQNYAVAGIIFAIYPISFFTSNYFLVARRVWLAESIFLLLILSIVVSYAINFNWFT